MRGNQGPGRDVQQRAERNARNDRGNGGRGNDVQRAQRIDREQIGRSIDHRAERLTQRRPALVSNFDDVARIRWEPENSMVRGCPPGLAKKNNGCMPPGLARQQLQQQQQARADDWYDDWWAYPDAQDLNYADGYLYRLGSGGGIASFLPLLGGALTPGNMWPDSFQAEPVPDYYQDYYGLDDGLDYRHANGAIYGVDTGSDLIRQVAALVTGDDWNIGQQMPEGYDVYNVPYEYRDQYVDNADAMYRYSDGYVYQVDPTSQLIQAAIQLIT